MDLDEVADELYAVAPEDFIALRKTRQDEARDDGDKALAKHIGTLPKPSAAAWACNLLVRAHREQIEGLVELGSLLRDAQENLAGDELKALNRQRAQLLAALTRQASTLAREQGRPISTSVADQVEDTLRAAMTEPEAGEALMSGRLTAPMSYSGMGTVTGRPELRLVPPPAPAKDGVPRTVRKKAAPAAGQGEPAAERREREREERRKAAEEKHRRELARARLAADDAEAAAGEARSAADEHRRQAGELAARHADLEGRVEELADQLAAAERDAAEAAAAHKRAQRRSAAADREAAEAADARDRALAAVHHLQEQGPG
jgi:DNA repair exonuclease SbcCD ATPase subunit